MVCATHTPTPAVTTPINTYLPHMLSVSHTQSTMATAGSSYTRCHILPFPHSQSVSHTQTHTHAACNLPLSTRRVSHMPPRICTPLSVSGTQGHLPYLCHTPIGFYPSPLVPVTGCHLHLHTCINSPSSLPIYLMHTSSSHLASHIHMHCLSRMSSVSHTGSFLQNSLLPLLRRLQPGCQPKIPHLQFHVLSDEKIS